VRKICSWCGLVQDVGTARDATVTHTICIKCMMEARRQMEEYERKKREKKTPIPGD
jgi:hypothetical protein